MKEPKVLYGLETEYGISREYPGPHYDVVAESISLVRAAKHDGVRMRWDYSCEDPHLDARGFRVDELRQDFDEANYFAQDAARPMSFSEIKSDLALRNGARFYNDHAHPEYCTPECATIHDLLIQDRLGDQLVADCAKALTTQTADSPEGRVRLYKNNTDFRGHSYGCHENYLVPRRVPWKTLSRHMIAFLVTRQIFAGAGKYGWEEEDRYAGPGFQISQRADFFSVLESVDTMQRRPIINTRDEPHADPERWRRFHVICGDANLSPYATYLKVGTTAAVLRLLASEVPLDQIPSLNDPIAAMRAISRDGTFQWKCSSENGLTNAIDVQRRYLELVREYAGEGTDGFRLADWESILNTLEKDPLTTADRLDWSAKHQLVEQFREAEGLGESDPWLMSLDLSYHLLDESEGLFHALTAQGSFLLPEGFEAKNDLTFEAPSHSRAAVRGLCVQLFGDHVEAAQWDHVRLRDETAGFELDLRRLFDPANIATALDIIAKARSVADLSTLPFANPLNPV